MTTNPPHGTHNTITALISAIRVGSTFLVGPTKGGHSAVRLTVKDQKQPEDGWCSQLPRSMAEHVAVNPRQSECNSHWCTCHSISSDLWLTYIRTHICTYVHSADTSHCRPCRSVHIVHSEFYNMCCHTGWYCALKTDREGHHQSSPSTDTPTY